MKSKKTGRIEIRVGMELKEKLENKAVNNSQTVTAIMRQLINNYLKNEVA